MGVQKMTDLSMENIILHINKNKPKLKQFKVISTCTEKETIEVSALNKEEAEELVLMGDYQDSQIKERTWQDQVIHDVKEIKDDE